MSGVSVRLAHGSAQQLSFFWNGQPLMGRAGDHVAAALLANGVRTLAWSRKLHRPLGLSGSYVSGVLARVDGVPNVRLDQVQLREGMRVDMQNCWPHPRLDLLRLARCIPARWVQGGFEHSRLIPSGTWLFQAWERLLAFLAGVARPADRLRAEAWSIPDGKAMTCQVLVIGAGPAGCAAANAAARQGQDVLLVTRGARPGSLATAAGLTLPPLSPRVRRLSGVEVAGAYRDGGLLLGVPIDPAQGALALSAEHVVLATGARSCAPLVPGGWLPGVMDARCALTLAHECAVAPGRAVVVVGSGDELAVAQRLRELGVTVVAVRSLSRLRRVIGRQRVRQVQFEDTLKCDALVHAGPWLSEASLQFQSAAAGLDQLRGGWSRFGRVGRAAQADQSLLVSPLEPLLLCPCMDVSGQEVAGLLPRPTLRPPRRHLTVAQAAGLVDTVEPLQ
ncbi:2Fe-2S iron-sulfur cluster-binding protein [Pseudomonas silvicola]|nr:2Fe-2S iron-sulfur cluster-binding protein [Pseudomonas silvicola]